ncbi:sulfurtransferase [Thermomonospora umbrina]|uniref:sulfurtransferase n=1 Tax=Thermomonospora umbrina TaxID=111806 RepID=UPI000E2451A4|nr:sulfurtransferase [Thermomonospora umbrina]
MHPLIDASELAELVLGPEPPTVLDVRWALTGPPGVEAYREGHVPGAVFVDLDRDLAGPPGPEGRHPLPDAARFEAAMRAAGVRRDRPVVVYDAADSTAAARAWWTLRYFGHGRVQVLNGGFRAWAEAGRPVSTDEPRPAPGDFTALPGSLPALDAEGAASLARRGVLLDARATERYRGEVEPIDPVAGHIPGALTAPTSGNVGADGRFLPAEALRERFAGLGATDAAEVGAYCGSGVTAAHQVLALALAGVPAALYVGSWSNWVADPSRPVATGD